MRVSAIGTEHGSTLEEEARVHGVGRDLVSRLAMLFKTVRIHSVQNSALQYSVKLFVQAANDLYAHLGEYTMRGDVDSVFINDIRIRPEAILWDNIVHLLSELSRRGVGGIAFTGVVTPVTTRTMLQALLDNPGLDPDKGAAILTDVVRGKGVLHVAFLPRMALVTDAAPIVEEEVAKAFQSMRVYTELLVTWKAYLAIGEESVPDIIRGRLLTAIQTAVDMLHDDIEWFLSSTTFRDEELYQCVHAVNTTMVAIAIGMRIGLSRKALMNLGMASIYASSGYRRFGVDQQMNVETGSAAERLGASAYRLRSVKEVLQTPALTRAQRDRIVVAYEHHITDEERHAPTRARARQRHLFSGVVALSARFNELTSSLGERRALSATEALEVLTTEAGLYDPRVLAVFVHMLGPFPIGTVVELSTGEVAVVFRTNPDPRLRSYPLVKIVQTSAGDTVSPTLFDLADGGEKDDFIAWIRAVLPPDDLGEVSPVQVIYAPTDEGGVVEAARPRWDS